VIPDDVTASQVSLGVAVQLASTPRFVLTSTVRVRRSRPGVFVSEIPFSLTRSFRSSGRYETSRVLVTAVPFTSAVMVSFPEVVVPDAQSCAARLGAAMKTPAVAHVVVTPSARSTQPTSLVTVYG